MRNTVTSSAWHCGALAVALVAPMLSACATTAVRPCILQDRPAKLASLVRSHDADVLTYYQFLRNRTPAQLAAERVAASNALVESDRLDSRLRLAMALSAGSNRPQDIERAVRLLEEGLAKKGALSCDPVAAEFVLESLRQRALLHANLDATEQRLKAKNTALVKDNQALKHQLDAESKQSQALARQLDQLKAIERSLNDRLYENKLREQGQTDAQPENPASR